MTFSPQDSSDGRLAGEQERATLNDPLILGLQKRGAIFKRLSVIIPEKMRWEILNILRESNQGMVKTKE